MAVRSLGILSASVLAIALHGNAWAQEAAAEGEAANEQGLGEIIVTAEKRSENVQRTPAAVTVVSGEALVDRGVASLADAQMLVPAARFNIEGNNTQIFVRGIGQNLDFPNLDPTVAFNFNGIYMPREATSSAFFDVASMEVLPGPQGTLYGRGAMGGTVNVQFQRPGFNNEGSLLVEGGNYDLIHGTWGQNLALSPDFAIRAAVDYRHRDGYFTSGADSADDIAGRLSFLYDSGPFTAYLWGFAAKADGSPPNLVNHSDNSPHFLTGNPFDDLGASAVTRSIYNSIPPGTLPFVVGTPFAGEKNYKVYSLGGQFDYEIGDVTLTYIPGYVNVQSKPFYWFGPFLFTNQADIESQSHELRLSGNSGSVEWLGGLFYYHQDYKGFFDSYGGFGLTAPIIQHAVDIRENTLKGFGIFGQATVSLSDTLRVTVGGRYSDDKREASGGDPEYRVPGAPASRFWTFKNDYSHFDWKIGLEYDVADQVMLYAGAQTAYQPGTYNSISQAGLNAGDPFINPGTPYDGETTINSAEMLAISGGVKSRFADNTLQFNLEGFYYEYKNLALQQFDASFLFTAVFNAEKVKVYGFQADMVWAPTSNDRLNVNVAYTHARNDRFVTPRGDVFSGLQPPYSPDWTIIGGYTHSFDLGSGKLDANLSGRYESPWFAAFTHQPGTRQESSFKLDASLNFDSGRGWQIGLWGKNLTNETVITATGGAGFPGPATSYLEAPRTYGVRLRFDY